jgi:glyoxylase-like metal-dependent hydrolase (beta-lactamase superfamily II)
MAIGDVRTVTAGSCTDLYYVDTGMYDAPEYGSVYLLDAEEPALIDAGIGTNYERILEMLETAGVGTDDLQWIVPTHVHLDHAGGAGFLAEECPNATVAIHERGARHLVDPTRLWEGTKSAVGGMLQYYTEPEPVPEDRVLELSDGDAIDLGDHELRVHEAPGHAPHQHVFHDPANEAVFTADAAGIYVPSRDVVRETTPPPQFDLERSIEDVELLRSLDPEVLLFGHFGPCDRLGVLDEYEERLREWVASVEAKRDALGDDEEVLEQFGRETATLMGDLWGEHKSFEEGKLNARGVLAYLDG